MGFYNFLLQQDALGHTFGVNYKGQSTFATPLGALITIVIKVLVKLKLSLNNNSDG